MMWFVGAFQSNKRMFSKECKIHSCCLLDYICTCSIAHKVEPRAHNEARTEPKPSEPGV